MTIDFAMKVLLGVSALTVLAMPAPSAATAPPGNPKTPPKPGRVIH